jgi:hypothetical protein
MSNIERHTALPVAKLRQSSPQPMPKGDTSGVPSPQTSCFKWLSIIRIQYFASRWCVVCSFTPPKRRRKRRRKKEEKKEKKEKGRFPHDSCYLGESDEMIDGVFETEAPANQVCFIRNEVHMAYRQSHLDSLRLVGAQARVESGFARIQ